MSYDTNMFFMPAVKRDYLIGDSWNVLSLNDFKDTQTVTIGKSFFCRWGKNNAIVKSLCEYSKYDKLLENFSLPPFSTVVIPLKTVYNAVKWYKNENKLQQQDVWTLKELQSYNSFDWRLCQIIIEAYERYGDWINFVIEHD